MISQCYPVLVCALKLICTHDLAGSREEGYLLTHVALCKPSGTMKNNIPVVCMHTYKCFSADADFQGNFYMPAGI